MPNHTEILKQVLIQLEKILEAHECPIKHDHSNDLVTASDGHIYDRAEITSWVHQGGVNATSPVTRGKISGVFYPAYAAIGAVEAVQNVMDFINQSLDPSYKPASKLAPAKPSTRETRCALLDKRSSLSVHVYHYVSKRYIPVKYIPDGTTNDLYDLYGYKMQLPEGSFKLACRGVLLPLGETLRNFVPDTGFTVVHLPDQV